LPQAIFLYLMGWELSYIFCLIWQKKNFPPSYHYWFFINLIHLLSLPKTNYHLIEIKLTYLIKSGLWLESLFFFCFEYFLQSWVVANHKSSKCLTFNGNSQELLVRNLLSPFKRERLLYLSVSSFLLYFRCFCIVLSSPFS
jgi:hypothetical protein